MKKHIIFGSLAVMAILGITQVFTYFDNMVGSSASAAINDIDTPPRSAQAWYAKFDGIDGESVDKDHHAWIDVLSIDWGTHKPASATGASRRRGAAVVEDISLTLETDKASPKLLEAVVKGKVFPKVEIHLTDSLADGTRAYYAYELKNAQISSYQLGGAYTDNPPTTTDVSLNFEEIKVTYTEYDKDGSKRGNVEFEWKVEEGTK